MPSISISLIRQAYGNATAEELSQIEVLNLSGLNINVIENLEVFAEIKELHLSHNCICNIENINFMYNLEFLDISYNNIDSNEIIRCIKNNELPSCLKTINLSGNLCCNDDNALCLLQESYNELNIIIGIEENNNNDDDNTYEPEINEDEDNDNDNDDSNENINETFVLQPDEQLDSDSVLKSLVERKCHLDKIKEYDIENAIEKLNKECDNTIKIRTYSINEKLKNTTIKDKIQSSTDVYFQELIGAKSKIEQMFENSKDDRNEMSSFMRKLRERSLHFRESAFSKLSEEK